MNYPITELSEEHKRIAINFEMAYDNYIQRKQAKELQFNYYIKQVNTQEYLYSIDRFNKNSEKSLGHLTGDLKREYEILLENKSLAEQYENQSRDHLEEMIDQFKIIKIPRLNKTIGKILRQFDKDELLGEYLLVVGSIAFFAYGLAAGIKDNNFFKPTLDLDFTWYKSAYLKKQNKTLNNKEFIDKKYKSFLYQLRLADKSFNMHTKKKYQAVNSEAFEVELLCSPSSQPSLLNIENQFKPYSLEEQEWLLNGTPIRQVLMDEDYQPVPIVAPDPRWMALHKLWLSQKATRDPLKTKKDLEQGKYLMQIIVARFKNDYPLDLNFIQDLPKELKPVMDKWCEENNFVPAKKNTLKF